jgi:hypothetical protein
MDLASTIIRSDITLFDDAVKSRDSTEPDETSLVRAAADGGDDADVAVQPRVIHGSVQQDITFADLELFHKEDIAFRHFRFKLTTYLATRLRIQKSKIKLQIDDVVSPSLYFVSLYPFTS